MQSLSIYFEDHLASMPIEDRNGQYVQVEDAVIYVMEANVDVEI